MILKLEDIWSLHLGKFMFSFKNNSVPYMHSFSRSILRTNQVHSYNKRSSNRFHIPFCCSNIREFSIFYQGPVFFKLNAFIWDAPSLYSFQSRVTWVQADWLLEECHKIWLAVGINGSQKRLFLRWLFSRVISRRPRKGSILLSFLVFYGLMVAKYALICAMEI